MTNSFVSPDPPQQIGEQWEHPITGIVYEWNGERWIVFSNNHGHDDTYVNRDGDSMNGPLILAGNPRIATEAANRSYVDNEIDELKVDIAGIIVEKGSARNYVVTSLTGDATAFKGSLSLNGSNPDRITKVSFHPQDVGGQASRVPEVNDIIEFDRTNDGLSHRFRVTAVPSGVTDIEVVDVGGLVLSYATNDQLTAFIYPQQNPGVSQPELDAAMNLKVSKSGDKMTGNLTIEDSDIKVNKGHLHILNGSIFGSITEVPLVIAREATDNGSMSRWYLDGQDALKIGNDARVTHLRGVDFQGPKHTGGDTEITLTNQAPPSWDKSGDFKLNINLVKENTYHNKFVITGNGGEWLWYSSGSTNECHLNNLKKLRIRTGVTSVDIETNVDFIGNKLTRFQGDVVIKGQNQAIGGSNILSIFPKNNEVNYYGNVTSNKNVATKEYVDNNTGGVPVGSIMMWMNANAPLGWFKLKGGTFDISKYPQLHAYLQNTHNYRDGVLPDWQGNYPGALGGSHLNYSLGQKVEQKTAKPSAGYPQSKISFPDGGTRTFNGSGGTNAYSNSKSFVKIDDNWDSVTRPPTVVVHFIIKHD